MNKMLRNTAMGAAAGLMVLATPTIAHAHAQGAGRAETAAAHPNQSVDDLATEIDLLGTDLLDVIL